MCHATTGARALSLKENNSYRAVNSSLGLQTMKEPVLVTVTTQQQAPSFRFIVGIWGANAVELTILQLRLNMHDGYEYNTLNGTSKLLIPHDSKANIDKLQSLNVMRSPNLVTPQHLRVRPQKGYWPLTEHQLVMEYSSPTKAGFGKFE